VVARAATVLVRDLIHDSAVMSRLPLDRSRIQDLFKLHVSGKRDAHPVLWATLMLLCFVARHDRSMGPAQAGGETGRLTFA